MIYGYIRVSTRGQIDGNSLEDQTNLIRARYSDAEIITEAASGAKERKIFTDLIKKLQSGDILVVSKLDRFCRTAKEGLQFADTLREKGVIIHILNLGIIENTPMGKMILTSLLCFAEFERASILERCASGKAIAKQNPNFKEGRPPKFKKEQKTHALQLLNTGNYTYRQIENLTGISLATLHRIRQTELKRFFDQNVLDYAELDTSN